MQQRLLGAASDTVKRPRVYRKLALWQDRHARAVPGIPTSLAERPENRSLGRVRVRAPFHHEPHNIAEHAFAVASTLLSLFLWAPC